MDSVASLLDDFLGLLNRENAPYSVAFRLIEICVIDVQTPAHIKDLLAKIKDMRGVEALDGLFARLARLQLQPVPRTAFIRYVLNTVVAKPGEIDELTRTLLDLLNRPETIPLLQSVAPLNEAGLVCDLLDAARASADPNTVGVATQLATMYKLCEDQQVREVALSVNMKNALMQQSADIGAVLPHLQGLLQNRAHHMAGFCVQLLNELANREADAMELLKFIAEKSGELLVTVQPDVVSAFWTAVLQARDASEVQTVKQLQSDFAKLKDKLVEMLNRLQGRATLKDVDGLMPKHTQTRELANVQPSLIRFFDLEREVWGPATQLRKTIQCDTSYVILDNGTVFICGGKY